MKLKFDEISLGKIAIFVWSVLMTYVLGRIFGFTAGMKFIPKQK